MKIKKLGHCCFVVEVNGKRIMTDPGSYSYLQDEEKNIDLIVITHEHPDHLHIESLKKVLENNSSAKIITNSSVGKILSLENISFDILEEGNNTTFDGVYFEAHGNTHSQIYKEFGLVQNTGYFIGEELFYPGDSFVNPNKKVEILALPVAGPWMKLSDAISYCLDLKPRICFPVHDGMIEEDKPGPIYRLPGSVLPEQGIEFKKLEIGVEGDI